MKKKTFRDLMQLLKPISNTKTIKGGNTETNGIRENVGEVIDSPPE